MPLVTQVTGGLGLGTGLNDLSIPLLQSVDSLSVQAVGLTQLELAALNHATTISVGQNPSLASVHVPLVTQLDTLNLGGPALQSAAFDQLASASTLSITEAPALETLSFPLLTQIVKALEVDTTGLGELSLAAVTFVDNLDVTGNPNLTSFALPAADVLDISVADNALLATIDLPSVKGPYLFSLSNNGKLTALAGFSGMTTVPGDFWILNHPALVDLQGLHGITKVGGQFHITGNTGGRRSRRRHRPTEHRRHARRAVASGALGPEPARVAPDDGLLRRDGQPAALFDQAGERGQALEANGHACPERRRVHVERHDDLFERSVSGAGAEAVHGDLHLACSQSHGGQGVGGREAKVVVTVKRNDRPARAPGRGRADRAGAALRLRATRGPPCRRS